MIIVKIGENEENSALKPFKGGNLGSNLYTKDV